MKNQSTIGVLCVITLASVLMTSGCGKKPEAPAAGQAADNRVLVKVTPVHLGAIDDTEQVVGNMSALRDVELSAKAQGRIQSVLVEEGAPVSIGQVVVQQDASDLIVQRQQVEATLAAAQAGLQQAYANRQQALAGVESAQAALKQAQTSAQAQPEQTAAAIRNAQALVNAAQARLKALQSGARPQERQQAENNVASARATLTRTKADLERYRKLAAQGAIAQQQLDAAQAAYDTATAQYNSAVEALNLIREGTRQEDIEAAQAQVRSAQAQLDTARANQSQNTISRQQVEAARAQVSQQRGQVSAADAAIRSAQAQISNAQAQINILNKQITNLSITSPINGVVAQKIAQPGQSGIPGNALLRIVDLGSVVFEGQVPQNQLRLFQSGQTVNVVTDAVPGKVFTGTIRRVYPAGDPSSRLFTIRIEVPNPTNELRPGMFARGQVTVKKYLNVTLVPKDAIVQVGEQTWVYVLEGEKVRKTPVKVVVSNDRESYVTGVTANQSIVVQGQNNLQDGSAVKLQ